MRRAFWNPRVDLIILLSKSVGGESYWPHLANISDELIKSRYSEFLQPRLEIFSKCLEHCYRKLEAKGVSTHSSRRALQKDMLTLLMSMYREGNVYAVDECATEKKRVLKQVFKQAH